LTTKEKVGFFAFLVFACVTIIFGFRGIGNAIKNPFAKSFEPPSPTDEDIKKRQMAELKTKDTDKDGLSDYDEIYVYNTSPYLADTDSDGMSDKDELLKGTDPNCPKGTTCLGFGGVFSQGAKSGEIATVPFQVPTTGQVLLQSLLNTNPDPKTLRGILIQNGVNKDVVNGLDDQALMELAKKAAGGANVPGGGTSEAGSVDVGVLEKTDTTARPPTDVEQIRALLRAQGVSEEQLKKIDDATLLSVYKEVLNPSTQSTSTAP